MKTFVPTHLFTLCSPVVNLAISGQRQMTGGRQVFKVLQQDVCQLAQAKPSTWPTFHQTQTERGDFRVRHGLRIRPPGALTEESWKHFGHNCANRTKWAATTHLRATRKWAMKVRGHAIRQLLQEVDKMQLLCREALQKGARVLIGGLWRLNMIKSL